MFASFEEVRKRIALYITFALINESLLGLQVAHVWICEVLEPLQLNLIMVVLNMGHRTAHGAGHWPRALSVVIVIPACLPCFGLDKYHDCSRDMPY